MTDKQQLDTFNKYFQPSLSSVLIWSEVRERFKQEMQISPMKLRKFLVKQGYQVLRARYEGKITKVVRGIEIRKLNLNNYS